jgi:diguanylate cyclase (GGDEF)-like protein/PAS domain S-box-containing protein
MYLTGQYALKNRFLAKLSLAKTNCALLTCLLLLTPLLQAAELEPVTLKLKWRHQFQFAGYYAALEKGFYEEAGFDVTLVEHLGGSDLFQPVIDGEYEFGIADSSIVVKRLQGSPVVVIAPIFQHSPLVLISLKEKGILSPLELVGKRVMFQKGADDASIQAMLTSLGVGPAVYELIPHNFSDFALIDEDLDIDVMSAYVSNQPFALQEAGYDIQIMDPANYGIDFYGDMLYASESYVASHTDRVIAFRDASLKGWSYALSHPKEVIGWLQNKYPSNKTVKELNYEADIIKNMIAANFIEIGTLHVGRFQRIAQIYKQLNLAPSNGTLDGLVLGDYLTAESDKTRQLLRLIGVIAIALFLALAVLVLVMQSLRRTIKKRTEELNILNDALTHQLHLTDQYVIAATLNLEDKFIDVSTALCNVSGYSREELLNISPESLSPKNAHADRKVVIERVLAGASEQGNMAQIHKNGSLYWLHTYADPVRNADGDVIGVRVTASDISEKKMIERLSETDGLTGIPNRKKLDNVLAVEWARHMRYQQNVAIILFDLDLFKKINDEFGHTEGDKALKLVAEVTSKSVRNIDLVGRWGGEEFMVILPQTNLTDAAIVAEKLRRAIAAIQGLAQPQITASFGVASSSQLTDLESLFSLADKALYRAKHNGRNRVELAE